MLKMPLARYFFFVGGALLALLLVFNAYGPQLPVADQTEAGGDLPVIRIHSDRKWPERVVFDTSMPAIAPAKPETVAVPATIAAVSAGDRVRGAFAQFIPADAKKPEPKLLPKLPPPKRRIAKSRVNPPTVLAAQQPRFGFFTNNWNN
jgi:hypothetical protein